MKQIETLYIVDDDDTYQFIVEKIIMASNQVKLIKIFSNGREAINFIESSIDNPSLIPEIILLDLTMPVMDGWEFLKNYPILKPRINKNVLIYIVSSSVNPTDVEKARNISEVTDYIVKPITSDKFMEIFTNL